MSDVLEMSTKVGALKEMLEGKGWTLVVKPALLAERERLLIGLLQSDGSNPNADAKMRAMALAASWMLEWESRAEAAAKELDSMTAHEVQQTLDLDAEPVGSIYR